MLAQLLKKLGRKKLIACEDDTLLLAIKYWLDEGDWKDFSDFEKFLELVGIDLPVTLSEYDWINQRFKCQTNSGRVVEVSLQVADYNAQVAIDSEISVKEGNTVTTYTCVTNYGGKAKPGIGIPRRTTTKNGRTLHTDWYSDHCSIKMEFSEKEETRFNIYYPYGSDKIIDKNAVDEYLVSLSSVEPNLAEKFAEIIGLDVEVK